MDTNESIAAELVCRFSMVLCEVEALEERINASPAVPLDDRVFIQSRLRKLHETVDSLLSFVSRPLRREYRQ
ncbi:MAG: hypothetical protein ABI837_09260 [Acidobacteriota bacterium]